MHRGCTSRLACAPACGGQVALGHHRRTPPLRRVQSRAMPLGSARSFFASIPLSVLTDSYKACHPLVYPEATKMVAYGEFRKGFRLARGHDEADTRVVAYGIRYIVENFLEQRWTLADVELASHFYSTHAAGFCEYPFPHELFEKFVRENDGFFPVRLEAVPEGTVVHANCPVYQITAEHEYACLCTFLETILTMMWYPSCVATLSRRAKDIIEVAFEKSVDGGRASPMLGSRLHDFGFRGCTCVEQSVIGGVAHLLNFDGSDTMSAGYYAQYVLNNGQPIAQSIPATEHSVMTAWATERAAIENMIERFGSGVFACVMDSFDYEHALSEVLPSVAAKKLGKGGFMVLRPDSGDPVETVMQGLHAAEKVFGCTVNSKGFKVPIGCSVIQGDGIGFDTLQLILNAVMDAGFSAQAVGFGMGGGLLQKVNRDTLSFATKLSHIEYKDGTTRDVMKAPKTDVNKFSLPGILQIRREDGVPTVYSIPDVGKGRPLVAAQDNLLRVVYDKRPVAGAWDDFSTIRARVAAEWAAAPLRADPISEQLKDRIKDISPAHAAAQFNV